MNTGSTPSNHKNPLHDFLLYALIFLVAGTIGCFIRLYPLRHYVSNDAWDKASLLVMSNLFASIRDDVRTRVPESIASDEKNLLVTEEFNAILARDKQQARQTILRTAKTLDQQNPPTRRVPYLLASDSYYFYDLSRTIIQTGALSSSIKGSKYFHPKMVSPAGYWEPLTLHPYIGAGLHVIFSAFRPDMDLMLSVSFTPLVLILLTLIPLLVLAKRLDISKWAALITACSLMFAQILLKRSTFTWYDNDAYNVLFPLLFLMILAHGFTHTEFKKKLSCALWLAISMLLYTLFWQGWMFAAAVLAASGVLITIIDKRPLIQKTGPAMIAAASFIIGISLLFGWKEILILFQEGWTALSGFLNAEISVWPDTYIAVGELRKTSLGTAINLTGGISFFMIAVIGATAEIIRGFKTRLSPRIKVAIISIIFTLAAIPITFGAQRFALLCVAPLTVLFLFGADAVILQARSFCSRLKKPAACVLHHLIPALLAAALIIPRSIQSDQSMPSLMDPLFNDTWNDALTSIRDASPPNTTVHSWWPPGHFIKAIAERPVTIDGATINDRQGYWLAHAFLATNEERALNYFRLLGNGANQAVDLLINSKMSDAQAVAFLNHLLHLPKSRALSLAQSVLGGNAAALISLTHHPSPATHLLLYNEMIEKFLLFPFITRWDMQKAEAINSNPALRRQIPSSRSADYMSFLWTLAGGYPRISGLMTPSGENHGVLIFRGNMIIDLNTKTCRVDSPQYGRGIPAFLFYQEGNAVIKKPLPGANLPYSVMIGRRYEQYEAMLLETPLAESLLMRLYFFGDTGLKNIRLISRHANLTRQMQIDIFAIAENTLKVEESK